MKLKTLKDFEKYDAKMAYELRREGKKISKFLEKGTNAGFIYMLNKPTNEQITEAKKQGIDLVKELTELAQINANETIGKIKFIKNFFNLRAI